MANFTFVIAFRPYRYINKRLLDDWNLCNCIQCIRNTLLNNERVSGGIHILTNRFSANSCREEFSYNLYYKI